MRFAFAALLLLPALVVAQQPDRPRGGGRPPSNSFAWWDSPIAADLNLSDQQQQQIRSNTREFRNKLFDTSNSLKKAEAELEDVINEETVDQARAAAAIEKVAAARADMTRTFSQLSLRLRSVLTYQQWQELQKRAPQHPGGPMGPGMGREGGRDGKMRNRRGESHPPPPPNQPQDDSPLL
ncbi:MAG: periplasmic heavy metal sensor [Bryobacteraceae bacterium]